MISLPDDAHGALAVGWATVELERAARELSHLLRPGATFVDAPSSVLLGARCQVGAAAEDADLRIVLLEPETEGRLAATLARHGEGWAAIWAATGDPAPGGRLSAARPGPFGSERMVLGGRRVAPQRLVVDVPSQP